MIKLTAFIFLFMSLLSASCQQPDEKDLYNEKNYVERHRGLHEAGYRIVYYYKHDTAYSIWKLYPDSLYQDTSFAVIKRYMHNNVMNGPSEYYSLGTLSAKGFMKANMRHGECLRYDIDGRLDRREFYNMGRKVGIWEDYYSTGLLFKKVYYDDGKYVKQEIYDTKTNGKLLRTEYEENTTD